MPWVYLHNLQYYIVNRFFFHVVWTVRISAFGVWYFSALPVQKRSTSGVNRKFSFSAVGIFYLNFFFKVDLRVKSRTWIEPGFYSIVQYSKHVIRYRLVLIHYSSAVQYFTYLNVYTIKKYIYRQPINYNVLVERDFFNFFLLRDCEQ